MGRVTILGGLCRRSQSYSDDPVGRSYTLSLSLSMAMEASRFEENKLGNIFKRAELTHTLE